jgi:hypothetical protein
MIALQNARTSRAQYILPIQPLRHMTIWHLSKPPRPSSLKALFLSHIFLAFFCTSYQKSRNLYSTNELSVSK